MAKTLIGIALALSFDPVNGPGVNFDVTTGSDDYPGEALGHTTGTIPVTQADLKNTA